MEGEIWAGPNLLPEPTFPSWRAWHGPHRAGLATIRVGALVSDQAHDQKFMAH